MSALRPLDALFALSCGCVLLGRSTSQVVTIWREVPSGHHRLLCPDHGSQVLTAVITSEAP